MKLIVLTAASILNFVFVSCHADSPGRTGEKQKTKDSLNIDPDNVNQRSAVEYIED